MATLDSPSTHRGTDLQIHCRQIADRARRAAIDLAGLSGDRKSAALRAAAAAIRADVAGILDANRRDVEAAPGYGLTPAAIDRLTLDPTRVEAIAAGMEAVAGQPDPIGETIDEETRPNGLVVRRIRVPLGVVFFIYESRPNVTADSAALCIKTSNAVILRGGSEALHSNAALADALQAGGRKKGLPDNAIQLIRTTDRDAIRELVQMTGRVDLAIPRGGEGLITAVVENARVPVIKHYKGVCHVYVDEAADQDMALQVIENAKCQRPGVCNAIEKVLVHQGIAQSFLPRLATHLGERRVELRGDEAARAIVPAMKAATEADWFAEYLDLILAVKVVPDTQAAVQHINHYGSHHSDSIITEAEPAKKVFTQEVDSATVYVNASTRFTDGGEFGMGAEIGISTEKLHARGPMGLEELTTYKYVIHGSGQIRR